MKKKCKKPISFFNSRTFFRICALGLLTFYFTSCANLQFQSGWRDRDINIDGRSDDWVGSLTYMDKQNISLGVLNDTDYLYVCLAAEDQAVISRILRQGMILWFDPEGGKEKTFGIKYPIGRQGMQQGEMMRPDNEADRQKMRRAMMAISNELEILQQSKVPIRTSIENLKGIEVFLKRSTGLIVYEIKIPLQENQDLPFAIGAKEGSEIGIGIEVPKMTMNMNRAAGGMGGRGGGMGGGGMGGRGGGMGGRGDGMGGGGMGGRSGGMGGQRANMQKGIKIWTTVQLASTK